MSSKVELLDIMADDLAAARATIRELQDELTLANMKIQSLQDSMQELIDMGKDFVSSATLALRG